MSRRPFTTGDVFRAPDPYHNDDPRVQDEDARPWLVLSTAAYPGQGREYVCCALTSYAADHADLIRLLPVDWVSGGPRRGSQIDPTTLFTVHHAWTGRHLGRVAAAKVNAARNRVKSFL